MSPHQFVRLLIEADDLRAEWQPAVELAPQDVTVVVVNEQLDSAAVEPSSDEEWLAWLARKGIS